MKRVLLLMGLLGATPAVASDLNLNNVYGQQVYGCVQTTLTTAGTAYRYLIPWTERHVLIWAELAADYATGDAMRFVLGGSTVDVTSLTSPTRVGETIFASAQRAVWVSATKPYISVISKTSGSKLNVCKLN